MVLPVPTSPYRYNPFGAFFGGSSGSETVFLANKREKSVGAEVDGGEGGTGGGL